MLSPISPFKEILNSRIQTNCYHQLYPESRSPVGPRLLISFDSSIFAVNDHHHGRISPEPGPSRSPPPLLSLRTDRPSTHFPPTVLSQKAEKATLRGSQCP